MLTGNNTVPQYRQPVSVVYRVCWSGGRVSPADPVVPGMVRGLRCAKAISTRTLNISIKTK